MYVAGADPYCIIKCEGEEVETPKIEDTVNPEWNARAIFYRSKMGSDLVVEVRMTGARWALMWRWRWYVWQGRDGL